MVERAQGVTCSSTAMMAVTLQTRMKELDGAKVALKETKSLTSVAVDPKAVAHIEELLKSDLLALTDFQSPVLKSDLRASTDFQSPAAGPKQVMG